jgi:hypothetical protein
MFSVSLLTLASVDKTDASVENLFSTREQQTEEKKRKERNKRVDGTETKV